MATPFLTQQISVREAMRYDVLEDGSYCCKIPASLCFANVALGGLLNSIVHSAAVDFVSRSSNITGWQNVLSMCTQFLRPALAYPLDTKLKFVVASISKKTAVLRFEISQKTKLCITGFVTLGDLESWGQEVTEAGFRLLPSPPIACLQDFELDRSSTWSGYLTPFDATSYRKPQSYIRYFVPVERSSANFMDQWVEPAWQDPHATRPLWTNENIHFVIDNALPLINDILHVDRNVSLYQKIVQAGLAQKKARQNHESDYLWGQGLSDHEVKFPWIISTVCISTDIQRLLPSSGCRWLFMRAMVKSIVGTKLNMEVVIMDTDSIIVAHSQHVCQIIPVDNKREKQANL